MSFQPGFLHSKVARRIVWLFFLSALVPIITTALLSYTYVSDLLIQQSQTQMRHAGKLYGMAVLERLLFIENKLRNTALIINTRQELQPDELHQYFGNELNALALIGSNKQINSLFIDQLTPAEIPPQSQEDYISNKANIFSVITPDGTQKIYMRLTLGSLQASGQSLIAEINQDYLWGDKETLPFSTFLCVVEDGAKVLFCSHPAPKQLLKEKDTDSVEAEARNIFWTYQNEKYLAVSWELFIKSRFNGPRWQIIASQREADALFLINTFNKIFPLVIALSLLVILLLSIWQIRRSLIPLERLLEGTQQVASKIFNKPVVVESQDEFATLANSFNMMTARLGKQIHAMTVLSEIDKLILSNPNIETVLLTTLKRIPNIAPCEFISICLTDKTDKEAGWAHVSHVDGKHAPKLKKIALPTSERKKLLEINNTFEVNLYKESWQFLDYFKKQGATQVQIFPITLGEKLAAVVSLGYRKKLLLSNDDIEYVRDLADRLAVALATADRDERLYRQAHYDMLTNLPNRQLFDDRLEQHINHAHRENQMIGLLYIDLDRFKNINDTLGHSVGDKLLQQTAERLKKCIREADTVARLGGDEFIIILSNITNPKDASNIAEHIISRVSQPFNIDLHEVFITPSIGITLYPIDGTTNEELLKHADAAMYRAKESGRGKYMFFEERMNIEDMERTRMEQDLRHALSRNELMLLYQPQVELESGRIIGAEALIRWIHPIRGMIEPTQFIPLAEDTGMIESIGEWVLRTACRQYKSWQEDGIIIDHLSVNVSSRQFMQRKFVDIVYKTLTATGMSPERLELEITESLLVEDRIDTVYILDELHAMGVKLAIDDFGTGYSSLSYLKRLPVDALKIDQSFMRDIPKNEDATTIANSIIALGHALKINVIAEGIETAEQLVLLLSQQCDSGQGFYFYPPLLPDDFVKAVHEQNSNSSSRSNSS
jgi:diguanylate cyclase (GGDEF)-like protein